MGNVNSLVGNCAMLSQINNTIPPIIAEAGINHNGLLKKALKLIDAAAAAGADAIKFQTFKAENIATKFAPKAKVIMVDIDKNELKKNDIKLNLKVESDANYFLEKLFYKLKKYSSITQPLSNNLNKTQPFQPHKQN